MFKKLMVYSMVLLLVLSLVLVGCTPKKEQNMTTITVAGSTSVQPIAEQLAKKFSEKNPNVKIEVQGGGSSVGIKAAMEGTADIGTSSRELKPEEKTVKEFMIAKDGIVVIVNPANKVDNLTLEQVKKIFTGEIKNWKEVGGEDLKITVINREEGSGTRGAFEELVLGKGNTFTSDAILQGSTGAVKSTVAGDKSAIGYISLGSVDSSVKKVKVDGVEATEETIINGTYKISRPFLFLTKNDPTGAVKDFIDFVLSPEGQDIISKEGFVKVK